MKTKTSDKVICPYCLTDSNGYGEEYYKNWADGYGDNENSFDCRNCGKAYTVERKSIYTTSGLEDPVRKFDIIGDVHGCFEELLELLEKLGYKDDEDFIYRHPEDRTLFFVGDITDRGPHNFETLQFVYNLYMSGAAEWVMGNHDNKLFRWMKGNKITINNGLQTTVEEFEGVTHFAGINLKEFGEMMLDELPKKYEDDHLIVVHACPTGAHMYGNRDKVTNERVDWWKDWKGKFTVVGHYWVDEPDVHEHWCCVDTGCVAGGKLSALRFPEKEIVSVKAFEAYVEK